MIILFGYFLHLSYFSQWVLSTFISWGHIIQSFSARSFAIVFLE